MSEEEYRALIQRMLEKLGEHYLRRVWLIVSVMAGGCADER